MQFSIRWKLFENEFYVTRLLQIFKLNSAFAEADHSFRFTLLDSQVFVDCLTESCLFQML